MPIAIGYYFGNVSDLLPPNFRIWFALFGFIVVILITRSTLKRLAKKDW
jgi:hypothetical protein